MCAEVVRTRMFRFDQELRVVSCVWSVLDMERVCVPSSTPPLVHPGFQVVAGLTAFPTAETTSAIIRDGDHGIQ